MSWLLARVHSGKNAWYVSTVVGRRGRIPQWQESVACILYLPDVTGTGGRDV